MRSFYNSPEPVEFGIVSWLEETRVVLPLKGVECRFEVTGAVASVELDQVYHQDNAVPLDCTYLFPLPAEAAIYRCELLVNGRLIRAVVEEEQEAREQFRHLRESGRRVAMVESERENLFTLALGNVQPGDVIVVRLAWFQVLERAGEGLRLLIPSCPGVRYIPGRPLLRANRGGGTEGDTNEVPDASRITPPRIDRLHPDAAYFVLSGRLGREDVAEGTASSSSHAVLVREQADVVHVALAHGGEVPNRDFVLTWREPVAQALEPRAWRWTTADGPYALVQLRAPENVAVAEERAQDFYFLVDRSSRMEGRKWEQACRALRACVELLGAQDRVWITLFESEYDDFAEEPWPALALQTDLAFQRLAECAPGGGTELQPAVEHVLDMIAGHSASRPTTLVLITGGAVGNEEGVREAFRRLPDLRVHTFGIDRAVNDAFLKELARQQHGRCWLQTPDDPIAETVSALAGRLRRPVLTDLAVSSGWEAGAPGLPDLHAGEVVTVALRGSGTAALEITGRLPDGQEYALPLAPETLGTSAVPLLWARERMAMLLAAGDQPAAVQLAREHNLLCRGAVFIAWDDAEQVSVAEAEVVQPSQELPTCETIYGGLEASAEAGDAWRGNTWFISSDLGRVREDDEVATYDQFDSLRAWREFAYWQEEMAAALERLGIARGDSAALLRWIVECGPEEREEAIEHARGLGYKDAESAVDTLAVALQRRMQKLAAEMDTLERVLVGLEVPPAFLIASALLTHCRPSPRIMRKAVSILRYVFSGLLKARERLLECGAPEEVAQAISEWAVGLRIADEPRHKELAKCVVLLDAAEFGNCARETVWQQVLDRTIGRAHPAYVLAGEWMPELEPPTPAGSDGARDTERWTDLFTAQSWVRLVEEEVEEGAGEGEIAREIVTRPG